MQVKIEVIEGTVHVVGKPYLRALVKFADNRIREVDAVEVV